MEKVHKGVVQIIKNLDRQYHISSKLIEKWQKKKDELTECIQY